MPELRIKVRMRECPTGWRYAIGIDGVWDLRYVSYEELRRMAEAEKTASGNRTDVTA